MGRLLDQVSVHLPGSSCTLLADRGLTGMALVKLCTARGWHYLLPPNESSATDRPPSPAFLTRAGEHAQIVHERSFCHLHLAHLQMDELRTRLRSHTQVLWLWLAIDPRSQILPVLHVGPRTQISAYTVIHAVRQILAAFLHPLFTSDGFNVYFYAAPRPFWTLAPGESPRPESLSVAGGDGPDLRPGEKATSGASWFV